MPSVDFFQDACDSLARDPAGDFILIYAQPGCKKSRWSIQVPTNESMQWMIERLKIAIKTWEETKNIPPEDRL